MITVSAQVICTVHNWASCEAAYGMAGTTVQCLI